MKKTAWMLVAMAAWWGCDGDASRSDDEDTSGAGASAANSSSSGTGGTLDAGQCRTDEDCAAGDFEQCFAPGASIGCGACQASDALCTGDAECKSQGEHFVCDPLPCACTIDETKCQPGCIDHDECGAAWLVCDATHRCAPKPCEIEQDCPEHFLCSDATCARRSCESDAACGNGYCVLGRCYPEPGFCSQLPA